MSKEKRVYTRYKTDFDGEFAIAGVGMRGLLSVQDFSRSGMNAVLNQKVMPSDLLKCEVRLPGSIMTCSMHGRVIWIREDESRADGYYRSGIEFETIDAFDRERLLEYCYQIYQQNQTSRKPAEGREIQP
ncbi:MAG: PilZ domain-containing protein [Candidatus Omnitrophica bacterium]|nr:PilZ domain-containing protein [Candidatus Omnitrophota bacterium]